MSERVTREERAHLRVWLDRVEPGELPLDMPPTIWHGLLDGLDAADSLAAAANEALSERASISGGFTKREDAVFDALAAYRALVEAPK